MAGQMNIRVPPTRHPTPANLQLAQPLRGLHINRINAKPPMRIHHFGCRQNFKMRTRWRLWTAINNRCNFNTKSMQIMRRTVRIIIIGKNGNAVTDSGCPAIGIGPHRPGQHNPRPVVIFKRDRTFRRPRT